MHIDDLQGVALAELTHAQHWQAKYRLITAWGKLIAPKPGIRTPEHQVKGCETLAWLIHEYHDGHHYFAFDSDSRIMNGLVALLLSIINNKTSAQLMGIDVSILLQASGLEKHLTPSRNNGFQKIIAQAYLLAGLEKLPLQQPVQ